MAKQKAERDRRLAEGLTKSSAQASGATHSANAAGGVDRDTLTEESKMDLRTAE